MSFDDLIRIVGPTQDGGVSAMNNAYSRWGEDVVHSFGTDLSHLIFEALDAALDADDPRAGTVENLSYAIDQLTKAKEALE